MVGRTYPLKACHAGHAKVRVMFSAPLGVLMTSSPPLRSLWLALLLLAAAVVPAVGLAEDTGLLDVKANVPDAIVLVDGEPLGAVPLLELLPAGRHQIIVTRDGFADWSQTVTLKADTQLELIANLARIAPALEVFVDIDKATVTVDGKVVGVGSHVVIDPTTPGTHQVAIAAPGYGQWVGAVTLRPGEVVPVRVNLRGSQGRLEIRSTPAGATVTVDGRDVGRTPVTVEPVAPGSHGVRIAMVGRAETLQNVVVDPGKVVNLETALLENGGTLEVKSNVEAARVSVNGVELGVGRQEIGSLEPGIYSIRVSAPGYTDFLKSAVAVEAGKRASVNAKLRPFEYGGTKLVGGDPVPVHRRPGFWGALGGGVGGAVVAAIIIAVVATPPDDTEPPITVDPPVVDSAFVLP